MEKLSTIFSILGNPTRLQIYNHILKEACECKLTKKKSLSDNCVSKISENLGLNQPTVSNHIKELMRASLVDVRKVGNVSYLFGCHGAMDEVIAFTKTSKQELNRTPNSFL